MYKEAHQSFAECWQILDVIKRGGEGKREGSQKKNHKGKVGVIGNKGTRYLIYIVFVLCDLSRNTSPA